MKKLLVMMVVAVFSVGSLAIAAEGRRDTVAVSKAKKEKKEKKDKKAKGKKETKKTEEAPADHGHEGEHADDHAAH
jgi:hypothetical protein